MSRVVGAFVCLRGVFVVECRPRRSGLEVLRSFDAHARIESAQEGVALLARTLQQAGIRKADVALAARGFGITPHVLTFPPAPENVLDTIIDREMRRLEPALTDPVIGWTRLPRDTDAGDGAETVDVLAATIARDVAQEFADAVARAGHELTHLTALQVSMHRLADEFVSGSETRALMALLPDGPYIGFSVGGAVRLVIDPPVPPGDPLPDAAAFAEEADLGAVFVRQQFRGATIANASVIASNESWPDVESALGARLGVPVARLAVADLGPGGTAAFGALIDQRSEHPVALAGRAVTRRAQARPALQLAAAGVVALAMLLAVWTLGQALVARQTSNALDAARRRINQESFAIEPVAETAARRRLVRDALAALRVVEQDRSALQQGIASIAAAVPAGIHVDSITLVRSDSGWRAAIGGSVAAATSGAAVRALSDFYRELPRRTPVESLSLKSISYPDTTIGSLVRFEIVFGMPPGARD